MFSVSLNKTFPSFLVHLWPCVRWQYVLLLNKFPFIAERVQQIVRGFNNDWKRALEVINQEVMRSFTNFKNGTQILQVGCGVAQKDW